ncbi:acyltransferase domain-containing protein [Actinophytocola sp.]|uniref:acyltransferase domain-containing protein n=1 Tax=Actinophytocola sp. TaxID=1872138 RepID=UPI00389AA500
MDTEARRHHLVPISAGTPQELRRVATGLADDLARRPAAPLAELAMAAATRQSDGPYRQAVVAADTTEAVRLLRRLPTVADTAADTPVDTATGRPVVFLFPGVGDHYAGMGRDLYRCEPEFRYWLDRCARVLTEQTGTDPRAALYAEPPARPDAVHDSGIDLARLLGRGDPDEDGPLDRTRVAQSVVFAVEYALARLLAGWGIVPAAMGGYSIGEYVAATVAGVLALEDALVLVARRAALIETLPPGALVSVLLPPARLAEYLDDELWLAAVNGPELCVVGGAPHAVERLEKRLTAAGVANLRARTRHAFHTELMAPVSEPLAALVGTFSLSPPAIPFLSNVDGTWITDEQATSPDYWARHLRRTVRCHHNLTELWRRPGAVALEVGPGQMLGGLAAQHPDAPRHPPVFATLPGAGRQPDTAAVLGVVGELWRLGVPVDWPALWREERR